MTRWAVACVCLLVAAESIARQPAQKDATVVVSETTAELSFPLPWRQVWAWGLDTTVDNLAEYAWQAEIQAGAEVYAIGYSRFKFAGQRQQNGSIDQLLEAGQADVWRRRGKSMTAERKIKATVKYLDGYVVVTVNGKSAIAQIFGTRPAEAKLVSQTPYAGSTTVTVPIHYRGPSREDE